MKHFISSKYFSKAIIEGAESRVVDVEAELQNIGNNQKQLEVSEEKARQREEKYQVTIFITNLQPWCKSQHGHHG